MEAVRNKIKSMEGRKDQFKYTAHNKIGFKPYKFIVR